ncbi:MAG: manganese efflux pump [Paenibacillaceae bacterium]|nr:manganese efflux pump [Paenibacillaceae bacterium]
MGATAVPGAWHHYSTLLLMAVALGMDALSLGIGIGLKGVRLLDIAKIGLVIAAFHVIMPLLGMFMGHYVSELLGDVATVTAGWLLIILGSHMVYSAVRGDAVQSIDHRSLWGLLLFALTVSIDSFSVGVSLGIFASDLLMAVLLFGAFGGAMSIAGLMIGRRAGHWVGGYGEAFGGLILLVFGVLFLI